MSVISKDIPVLPVGVVLGTDSITDEGLRETYPLNETGRFMLSLIDGQTDVNSIARKVAETYKIDHQTALRDVSSFLDQLYEQFLLNINRRNIAIRIQFFWHYVKTLQIGPLIRLFSFHRRFAIPTSMRSPLPILFYLLFQIPYYYRLLLIGFPLLLTLLTEAPLVQAILFTFHLALSIVVHEYAHIIGLYIVGEKQAFAFLGQKNYTIGVYRKKLSPWKEIFVSLLGPAVPLVIGLQLYFFARSTYDVGLGIVSFVWIDGIRWTVGFATWGASRGRNLLPQRTL